MTGSGLCAAQPGAALLQRVDERRPERQPPLQPGHGLRAGARSTGTPAGISRQKRTSSPRRQAPSPFKRVSIGADRERLTARRHARAGIQQDAHAQRARLVADERHSCARRLRTRESRPVRARRRGASSLSAGTVTGTVTRSTAVAKPGLGDEAHVTNHDQCHGQAMESDGARPKGTGRYYDADAMSMPSITRTVGFLLVLLGVVGYFGTGRASVTALIPALVGAVFLVLALVARNPDARKHAMHAGRGARAAGRARCTRRGSSPACALATPAARRALADRHGADSAALRALGVKSFIDARRPR